MCGRILYAFLIITSILIIAAVLCFSVKPSNDGYLVAPYLDLDAPGERGSYYGLVDCP